MYVHCTTIYLNCTVYFTMLSRTARVFASHVLPTPHHGSRRLWTKWVWSQHAVAPLISDLVARLPTLKDLHERAAQFAGIMADSQEKLTNQISDLQSLLTMLAYNKSCLIMICYCRFRAHSCPQSSQSSAD